MTLRAGRRSGSTRPGLELGDGRPGELRRLEQGRVIEQDPGAGDAVDEGSEVDLVISAGVGDGDACPYVLGTARAEAEAELDDRGLGRRLRGGQDSDEPEDTVIGTDPNAATPVEVGGDGDASCSPPGPSRCRTSSGCTEDEATRDPGRRRASRSTCVEDTTTPVGAGQGAEPGPGRRRRGAARLDGRRSRSRATRSPRPPRRPTPTETPTETRRDPTETPTETDERGSPGAGGPGGGPGRRARRRRPVGGEAAVRADRPSTRRRRRGRRGQDVQPRRARRTGGRSSPRRPAPRPRLRARPPSRAA